MPTRCHYRSCYMHGSTLHCVSKVTARLTGSAEGAVVSWAAVLKLVEAAEEENSIILITLERRRKEREERATTAK